MKIKSVVENAEGTFEFSAELSPSQHAFLLEYAIRDLVRKGLVPFLSAEKEEDLTKVIPVSNEFQQ